MVNNFRDMLLDVFDKHSDKVAIIENKEGNLNKIKYKTLRNDIISFGTALNYKLKIVNSKVGVIGENSYKWLVTYYATVCGGNIIVPLDSKLPDTEIINLIKRSKIKCLVYSSKLAEIINKIVDKVDKDICFIKMDSNDDSGYTFNKMLIEGKKIINSGRKDYLDIKVNENDFCSLLFTSGTTSRSKGVMLSQKNIISNVKTIDKLYGKYFEGKRFLSFLPMHHTYEFTITYCTGLYLGMEIAISRGIRYVSEDIKIYKPDAMCAVPLLLENIKKKIEKNIRLQNKKTIVDITKGITSFMSSDIKRVIFKSIHENFGGNFKYILTAGAPISKETIDVMESFGFEILQGYGLTETSPLVAGTRVENRVSGTVGKPIDGVEVRIDILPNEVEDAGEIMVKGPNVMLGYYNNKEETDKVIKKGWFYTGDIGYFDKKGNIVISGRTKNVIVTSNGKNIYPEEIEELINKIKIIEECIVYGKERRKNELEVAVTVRTDNEYLKEKYGAKIPTKEEQHEIIWKEIKKVNKKLPKYKAIRYLKIQEEEFIKTTTHKVKRKENI